jgi:signal transduction histidine kinase/CheY-like chemotaxis protein
MKIFSFKSIKTRLTFWFLTIALIPLSVALLVTYIQRANVIETRTIDKLTAIRDLKVKSVQNWLAERVSDIGVLSTDHELEPLENLIDKDNKNQNAKDTLDRIRHYLIHYMGFYDAYNKLYIINPSTAIVIVSTDKSTEGNDKSMDVSYTKPMQSRELYIKDIHISETSSIYEMDYSIPIFCNKHSGEHIIGILVAGIDLRNTLYKMLADRIGLGKTGESFIVNNDDIVLSELRWHENAPMNIKISAGPAVMAAQGKTGIMVATDYRGEEVLAAYTYIPETGWGFVCKQDLIEVNAPIQNIIFNFILVFFSSALAIYLLANFIGRTISEPIIRMDELAKNIQAGDLSVRNVVDSQDELGSLAASINKMTDSIESKNTIQMGITNISETMIGLPSLQEFGSGLLKQLMETTGANMSAFYILDEMKSEFVYFTSIGANEDLLKPFNSKNPGGEFGNALSKKSAYYLKEIPEDTILKFQTTAGEAIPKEIITIPILVENNVVAIISLVNIHKFDKECYDIIEHSMTNINSSYSGVISNERTTILAETLASTNQKLEAQTEELQEQAEELTQTSEKLYEQNIELDMQRKEVENANRLKSEFLSNMSHELRTPLNSILALSHVLTQKTADRLSDEEMNYLKVVERNGKQLLELINDILDLSKIEAGQMDINPSTISLSDIVNDIAGSIKPMVIDKGIDLKVNFAKDFPSITTDEFLFNRILQNIISNAVKFTEQGKVLITGEYNKDQISIIVKDTGIGIPTESVDHIFDEFRQLDGGTARRFEGTGLGLAIAKHSAVLLGGDIYIESKENEGSTFTIELPLELPELENIAHKFSQFTPNRESFIIQLSDLLEQSGFNFDVARGGQKAIDYCNKSIPDGIILDLAMPEVDGFQVLETIRRKSATKKVPILILTAKDLTKSDMKRLNANNIQQLVQKGDINKDKLIKKIKMMLGDERKPVKKTEDEPKISKSKKMRKRTTGARSKPTVLIVEDNIDNMISIKAALPAEYITLEATDGQEGLKMIQEHKPDLVLMDIMLPKLDGISVLREVRAKKSLQEIPIIAITAKAMKGDKEKLLKAGFDDYIPKPFDVNELMNKIKLFIKK